MYEIKINSTLWFAVEMEKLRALHVTSIGEEPRGWAIGIDEYLNLKKEIYSRLNKEQQQKFGEVICYQGLPLHIKSTRGIELLLDVKAATVFKQVSQKMKTVKSEMI